jgi:hypothetical protein
VLVAFNRITANRTKDARMVDLQFRYLIEIPLDVFGRVVGGQSTPAPLALWVLDAYVNVLLDYK